MKKGILSLALTCFVLTVFAQLDITKRKVSLDSLNARGSIIYINDDVTIKDTTLKAYIETHSAAVSAAAVSAAAGLTYEIQVNVGGGLASSANFTWNDTTLTINGPNNNLFIGTNTGAALTSGTNNTFIGIDAGNSNTSGLLNTVIGKASGNSMTTGDSNTMLGHNSGFSITSEDDNVFIGYQSGYNTTGSNNVTIGYQAGHDAVGAGNVFLGRLAGYSEVGSNKLYIENSNSATPLIYGDFANDTVIINGSIKVTGKFIDVAPRIGLYIPEDSVCTTVIGTPDQFEFMGDGANSKFLDNYNRNFAYDSDTLQYTSTTPNYFYLEHGGTVKCSSAQETVHVVIYINDVEQKQLLSSTYCTTASQEYPIAGMSNIIYLEENDKIKIMITSDSATTITTEHFSMTIYKIN
jgi:hypothetical protein